VSWFNRGTLHLVGRDDYWWLHELTTPQLTTSINSRLRRLGVDAAAAERGVAAVERALADGPLTRAELREHVAAADVPTEGQALVHVLFLATLRGLIVRGPMRGREQAVVLVRDWLGAPQKFDRARALAELARRYVRGHPYGDDRDLARWANLSLGEVRRGLADAGVEPESARPAPLPSPMLLGAFEPVLLGWRDRSWILPDAVQAQRLVTDNGIFRPFLLVGNFGNGRIHAYDAKTGALKGTLRNRAGHVIVLGGLWGLLFGNGTSAPKTTLMFTSGPGGEQHGKWGTIAAA
ncbi:MAG TPA: crosslink repair DNA glycosylase YcaQ family protein, partial [Mycobacteriales bacterium]|nr:crosslink repair DNA glycosylase YcaQ family protein [Mycobacteriales bacterium]